MFSVFPLATSLLETDSYSDSVSQLWVTDAPSGLYLGQNGTQKKREKECWPSLGYYIYSTVLSLRRLFTPQIHLQVIVRCVWPLFLKAIDAGVQERCILIQESGCNVACCKWLDPMLDLRPFQRLTDKCFVWTHPVICKLFLKQVDIISRVIYDINDDAQKGQVRICLAYKRLIRLWYTFHNFPKKLF